MHRPNGQFVLLRLFVKNVSYRVIDAVLFIFYFVLYSSSSLEGKQLLQEWNFIYFGQFFFYSSVDLLGNKPF